MKTNNQSFEQQLKRLEEIVGILDSNEESLENMLKYYEEGMALSRSLNEFLENAEQKVINISKTAIT